MDLLTLKLPEELRQMILLCLQYDLKPFYSLYDTSSSLRGSVVVFLPHYHPQLGILLAAKTGNSEILQKIAHYYPEALVNMNQLNRVPLMGLCPGDAVEKAAKRGHTEVVRILLTFRGSHSDGKALLEAAKRGYASVVSILLKVSPEPWSYYEAYCEATERGYMDITKVFHEQGLNPDSELSKRILQLHKARKLKEGMEQSVKRRKI
jgi:hypothetical protein